MASSGSGSGFGPGDTDWSRRGPFLSAGEQLLKLGGDVGAETVGYVPASARRFNEFRQHIACSHDDVENMLGLLDAIIAQPVEQGFEYMRKLDQLFEIESSGAGLDRMNRPENRVQGF